MSTDLDSLCHFLCPIKNLVDLCGLTQKFNIQNEYFYCFYSLKKSKWDSVMTKFHCSYTFQQNCWSHGVLKQTYF